MEILLCPAAYFTCLGKSSLILCRINVRLCTEVFGKAFKGLDFYFSDLCSWGGDIICSETNWIVDWLWIFCQFINPNSYSNDLIDNFRGSWFPNYKFWCPIKKIYTHFPCISMVSSKLLNSSNYIRDEYFFRGQSSSQTAQTDWRRGLLSDRLLISHCLSVNTQQLRGSRLTWGRDKERFSHHRRGSRSKPPIISTFFHNQSL